LRFWLKTKTGFSGMVTFIFIQSVIQTTPKQFTGHTKTP